MGALSSPPACVAYPLAPIGKMRIALFEPEIAGNVGAVLRLGACLGAAVDLIEPMGFEWDDRRVRRTAMDYIDHVTIVRHADFDAFRATIGPRRLVLFTTKIRQSAYDFDFAAEDVLLFGKEAQGCPCDMGYLRCTGAYSNAAAGALDEPCHIGRAGTRRSITANGFATDLTAGVTRHLNFGFRRQCGHSAVSAAYLKSAVRC